MADEGVAAAPKLVTKKLGPLPVWTWVVILAASIGAVVILKHRGSSTASGESIVPAATLAGSGAAPGDGGTSLGGVSQPVTQQELKDAMADFATKLAALQPAPLTSLMPSPWAGPGPLPAQPIGSNTSGGGLDAWAAASPPPPPPAEIWIARQIHSLDSLPNIGPTLGAWDTAHPGIPIRDSPGGSIVNFAGWGTSLRSTGRVNGPGTYPGQSNIWHQVSGGVVNESDLVPS